MSDICTPEAGAGPGPAVRGAPSPGGRGLCPGHGGLPLSLSPREGLTLGRSTFVALGILCSSARVAADKSPVTFGGNQVSCPPPSHSQAAPPSFSQS